MPSVWNFVGVEARTALTAFVFQVTTASGGTTPAFGFSAAADNDTVAPIARTPARTSNVLSCGLPFFISPPYLTGSPRRRGPDRARHAARQAQPHGPPARRRRRSRSRLRECR